MEDYLKYNVKSLGMPDSLFMYLSSKKDKFKNEILSFKSNSQDEFFNKVFDYLNHSHKFLLERHTRFISLRKYYRIFNLMNVDRKNYNNLMNLCFIEYPLEDYEYLKNFSSDEDLLNAIKYNMKLTYELYRGLVYIFEHGLIAEHKNIKIPLKSYAKENNEYSNFVALNNKGQEQITTVFNNFYGPSIQKDVVKTKYTNNNKEIVLNLDYYAFDNKYANIWVGFHSKTYGCWELIIDVANDVDKELGIKTNINLWDLSKIRVGLDIPVNTVAIESSSKYVTQ